MEILSSDWLRRMADRAAATPRGRIMALFGVLQDWMDAPGIRQLLQAESLTDAGQREIKTYLLHLATGAGVSNPEVLASQLSLVLFGALNEELRNPGSGALLQAGQAADLLVAGHIDTRRSPQRYVRHIAPLTVALVAIAVLMPYPDSLAPVEQLRPQPVRTIPTVSNPDQVAAIYHMHDAMRAGDCGYPQALMLPPEQRAVYLEHVISGSVERLAPETLVMVNQLYQKVQCYYPPAAMLL
jgi:hypothetical protein